MYLEIKRRRMADGKSGESLYVCRYVHGVRSRVYVRLADAPSVIEKVLTHKAAAAKTAPRQPGRPGRPPKMPEAMWEIAKAAGYSTSGTRLKMSKKSFLTPEAARMRFALMDSEIQAAIESWENLHMATLKAHALMKSRNRRSITTTFDACLAEALADNPPQ